MVYLRPDCGVIGTPYLTGPNSLQWNESGPASCLYSSYERLFFCPNARRSNWWDSHQLIAADKQIVSFWIADADHNDANDVLVGIEDGTLRWHLQGEGFDFSETRLVSDNLPGLVNAVASDFNGDDYLEIVTLQSNGALQQIQQRAKSK